MPRREVFEVVVVAVQTVVEVIDVVAGSLHVVFGTVVDVHTNYQELLSLLVDLCVRVAILTN